MARTTTRTADVEPLPVLPPGTELVTAEQLAAAELAAQQADAQLTAEERKAGSGQTLPALALKARRANAELARLRDAHDAQDRLLQHRGAAEEAARPVVAEMAEQLEVSRRDATAKIIEFQRAAAAMIESVRAHGEQVRQASAELAGRGLLAADVFGDHETGGQVDGKGVRLGKNWWGSPDSSGLFTWAIAAVALREWGEAHPLAAMRRDFRVGSAVRQAAAVLKDVPDLPPRPPGSKAG